MPNWNWRLLPIGLVALLFGSNSQAWEIPPPPEFCGRVVLGEPQPLQLPGSIKLTAVVVAAPRIEQKSVIPQVRTPSPEHELVERLPPSTLNDRPSPSPPNLLPPINLPQHAAPTLAPPIIPQNIPLGPPIPQPLVRQEIVPPRYQPLAPPSFIMNEGAGNAGCCGSGHSPSQAPSNPRPRARDGLFSESCPRMNLVLWSGYDSWRGISDGAFQNNNGTSLGFNSGVPLIEEFGIGGQFGGSYGTYDYMGRPLAETTKVQQQFFATAGIFRRADQNLPLSFGLAYDAMVNDNFGQFSDEPFLSQWRAQAALAINARNEIGVWGSWIDHTDTSNPAGVGPLTYRPVSQVNVFVHHKFECLSADVWFWFGSPNNGSRGSNGTLGEFILGTAATVPIGDRMGAYFNCAYMKPSADAGPAASSQEGFNLSAGLSFYPGGTARSATVAGRKWMPLLPVANNGTFWVDQF